MAAAVWLLRILWRGARRLVAQIRDRFRRDWLDRIGSLEGWSPETIAEIRELSRIYRESYCDECRAFEWPQGRCPSCRERLRNALERARFERAAIVGTRAE